MDLATAWKAFRGIVRDAQEAIDILDEYFRESTGESSGPRAYRIHRFP